jgi:hypothetical protein
MPTKAKSALLTTPHDVDELVIQACSTAAQLPRAELLAAAAIRGCYYYLPLWPHLSPRELASMPHEVLGCALLRGPQDVETFQAIRCGAMVLSDLGNIPERIAVAAEKLCVGGRVAHIARLALAADGHPDFWTKILAALPGNPVEELDFLPGVSRLVAETRRSGPNKGPVRTWLRTAYQR